MRARTPLRHSGSGRVVVAVLVVLGVVLASAGCAPSSGNGSAKPAATVTSAPHSPGTAPSNPAVALRRVHSPGAVDVDLQLRAGQCRVRVLDASRGAVLPDSACTPGSVDPAVTQATIAATVCRRGYTRTVRPPESATGPAKHASLVAYGMAYRPTIEYDHLVPLSLGGANAVSNLWPELNAAGAHGPANPKDDVESALHDAVCAGRVTLAAAQQAIAADWTTAEVRLGLRG